MSAAWRRQTGGRAGPALAVPLVSQTPARFRGEVPCERQRQLSLLIYDWAAVVTRGATLETASSGGREVEEDLLQLQF